MRVPLPLLRGKLAHSQDAHGHEVQVGLIILVLQSTADGSNLFNQRWSKMTIPQEMDDILGYHCSKLKCVHQLACHLRLDVRTELAEGFRFWLKDVAIEFLAILDWEKHRVESANCSKIVGRE